LFAGYPKAETIFRELHPIIESRIFGEVSQETRDIEEFQSKRCRHGSKELPQRA
jgi:hypothetical protein